MTKERDPYLEAVLDHLLEQRGFDFSGYHTAMLEHRIDRRLAATGCGDFGAYLGHLKNHDAEVDRLLDAITINVSRFFRDSLTFELIADKVLPALLREKGLSGNRSLRVWSAGCARGEEPYSLAILIREWLEKEETAVPLHLFATDIDRDALADAGKALYPLSSVDHIKHRLLVKYFTPEGACFRLKPEIRTMAAFSLHDILDRKRPVPPESVFGNFDLVLCRNLLIYFNTECQERIFERLHHSLADRGVLVVGEAEAPTPGQQNHFSRVFDFAPIYRKRQGGK